MIISDLQYIETTETEVTGAGRHGGYKPRAYNVAGAQAVAEAFGYNTKAFTTTSTLVIEGNYSGAYSNSSSESF